MLSHNFDQMVRMCFSPILVPHGFSCEASVRSTFYRRVSEEVWHFIMADMRFHRSVYEVRVFFSSPAIDPDFLKSFPDGLGIPSDLHSVLRIAHGITHTPSLFPYSTKQSFNTGFEKAVGFALLTEALPFLDAICSVSDMLPLIKHPFFAEHAHSYLNGRSGIRNTNSTNES